MCHEYDSSPPELPAELVYPPMAGRASAEIATLTAADGSPLSVAFAPVDEPAPGVVILPDVRGLYPFYVELAERFASAGKHAVVIDYFGRTAGAGLRGEEFQWLEHLGSVSPEQVQADIAVARDALRERADVRAVVTVGFCYGGANSYLAATNEQLALDGAIGFYGTLRPSRAGQLPFPMPEPLGNMRRARCPVLALFGGADPNIPAEDIAEFEGELRDSGVEHEVVTYPGAPHSFFDRSAAEHADASADAWRRVIDFVDRIPAPTPT